MSGYYTDYSFAVIVGYDDNSNPILNEFASYEEACEYYGKEISIIQPQ